MSDLPQMDKEAAAWWKALVKPIFFAMRDKGIGALRITRVADVKVSFVLEPETDDHIVDPDLPEDIQRILRGGRPQNAEEASGLEAPAAMAISTEQRLMNTLQRTVDALVGIMTSLDAPAETMEALTAGDLEHVCWWVTTHRAAAANSERVERDHAALKLPPRPRVVCLCGSTRFREAFEEANQRETLAGNIVLTIGCDMKSPAALELPPETKPKLDELHLRKIDLADEVLILNVGGYIGESTARELSYAREQGKAVRFLEPQPEGEGDGK